MAKKSIHVKRLDSIQKQAHLSNGTVKLPSPYSTIVYALHFACVYIIVLHPPTTEPLRTPSHRV